MISAQYMLMNIDFVSIYYFLKLYADENIFIDICALFLLNTFARQQNMLKCTCGTVVLS